MDYLSNIAENRLAALEHQVDIVDQMIASATECEKENEDADWECVIGALTDLRSNVRHQIETISDWDNERCENEAAEYADYKRDLKMECA
ncbi:MAG: hypothetical protein ABF542_10770 [Gluconobacter sp.]